MSEPVVARTGHRIKFRGNVADHMRVHRVRSLPLLARFSFLSTLVMVVLGVVLTGVLADRVEDRAHRNAEQLGRAIAIAGVEEHIDGRRLESMTPAELDDMDALLRTERLRSTGVRRVKLFDPEGRLVYSDDRSQIGSVVPRHSPVRIALNGGITSKLVMGTRHDGTGERLLEVYVPLVHGTSDEPAGVFEVYLPYGPVAAAIESDTRYVLVVVIAGLLALWLALFRIVKRASSQLRRQAAENRHQARHDALTGLANRRALHEQGTLALESEASGGHAALLLIDLDHFKEINDTLGHEHGDLLLQQVGKRLSEAVRAGDVLARLGGDEFAVLLPGLPGAEAAAERARVLLRAMAEPIQLPTLAVRVEGSIGVAVHPEHGGTVDELLKHADVAMYTAKNTAERIRVYTPELDPYSHERLELATELRAAIDRGELVVHYQPIIATRDGRARGAEALVRWQHPKRGLLPPGEFLPLAEHTGAIGPLTTFVIEQAVQDAYRWQEAGHDLGVACNLASASASDPLLPDLVASALERWPLEPHRLTLELSEDTVITDPRRVGEVLQRLSALGVRIALDDFGTGKSSLAHLRRLPLHELKIDRSFVAGLLDDGQDRALVEAIISLAHGLHLETVGEGVEDADVASALALRGCDHLQGFHYSRPVAVDEFERWLTHHVMAQSVDAPPAAPGSPARAVG